MKKKKEFDQERLAQLKLNFNNSSKFWQTIRSIDRKSIICNSITSEQWYEHFCRVFSTFDSLPEEENEDDVMEDEVAGIFGETVSRDEVTAGIHNLKPGKNAGPDKTISEMLKHANESLVDLFGPAL